ncbi:unnamed protein product [Clonostachys byssicola]|uniref:Zn(2)-C6 fungal-type domain-containing protein n=1 Tax=Clonostachys byssicola TaxID=160290 RepID=A0A9N9UZL4_9HYPO|nr:unnamed protein product [Clonostachys byssicola]
MTSQPRLPACDPCRASKLACDHVRPVCGRCRAKAQGSSCEYRQRPFKKTRRTIGGGPSPQINKNDQTVHRHRSETVSSSSTPVSGPLQKPNRYPNPGYLGSSSYTTLFGQLPLGGGNSADGDGFNATPKNGTISEAMVNEAQVSHGAELIEQLHRFPHIPACVRLVKGWLATGANLALTESFTEQCAESAELILTGAQLGSRTAIEVSRDLFTHSCQPLIVNSSTTIEDFTAQFTNDNSRWESLCLFFMSVSRAALTFRSHHPPFDSEKQRRNLRRLSMYYADRCLDMSLMLDCLNDLQLMLQYENFILHTLIDGDQSFEAWRRLGDVASSLFALGYHQDTHGGSSIPEFLKALRSSTFAVSYSADKNVSIFLGRPPRINQKFCQFSRTGPDSYFSHEWPPDAKFDSKAESRWAAICAVLKEDILDISGEKNQEDKIRRASVIKAEADLQWESLPAHFKLEGPMKSQDCSPVELDKLLGTKLNYLHVLFLLRQALRRRTSDWDPELNSVAGQMLSLVVEALMLREGLVNSGTSLVWKVVYYGLAAAGVICLALLQQGPATDCVEMDTSKVFRELAVLVSEVELGTLVYKEDANYALLAGATSTIKNLIDRLSSGRFDQFRATQSNVEAAAENASPVEGETWNPWGSASVQDFESNFWLTLAEHPFLMSEEFAFEIASPGMDLTRKGYLIPLETNRSSSVHIGDKLHFNLSQAGFKVIYDPEVANYNPENTANCVHVPCLQYATTKLPRLSIRSFCQIARALRPAMAWQNTGHLRSEKKEFSGLSSLSDIEDTSLGLLLHAIMKRLPVELVGNIIQCVGDGLFSSLTMTSESLAWIRTIGFTRIMKSENYLSNKQVFSVYNDIQHLGFDSVQVMGEDCLIELQYDPKVCSSRIPVAKKQIKGLEFGLGFYGVIGLRVVYVDDSSSPWLGHKSPK